MTSCSSTSRSLRVPLLCLYRKYDEVWDQCLPLTDPLPRPDYAVGFRQSDIRTSKDGEAPLYPLGNPARRVLHAWPPATCTSITQLTSLTTHTQFILSLSSFTLTASIFTQPHSTRLNHERPSFNRSSPLLLRFRGRRSVHRIDIG
jgi:hypothetical protein